MFATPAATRKAVEALPASPDHMFWFEYNFLYVLAAGGRAEKKALGDHTAAGYQQRARFYAVSDEGRLNFAKGIARYIVFLAENAGLAPAARCAAARKLLDRYATMATSSPTSAAEGRLRRRLRSYPGSAAARAVAAQVLAASRFSSCAISSLSSPAGSRSRRAAMRARGSDESAEGDFSAASRVTCRASW